jgi:hypothetical protein
MANGLSLEVVITKDILPNLVGQYGHAADLGLDAWAADTLQECKSNAPIKTGALRASGYRVSPVTNTYGEAAAAFSSRSSREGAAPQAHLEKHQAVAGFCAPYALFVNSGHHAGSGFVPARPFFTNGILAKKDRLAFHITHYVKALCDTGHV